MRLKRTNFIEKFKNQLNDDFYIRNYLPKLEQILKNEDEFI